MSYNNKTITAPVTISDVKKALGKSSNNLGVLCTSENINKWAKYKPVIHPDDSRNEGEYNTVDGKAGLNIKYVILSDSGTYTQNAIRNLYTDAENWTYNLPTGGADSPYRLGDFRGYQVNSYPLAQGIYTKGVSNRVPTGTGVFSYPFSCYLPADSADSEGDGESYTLANNLQFKDITMYIEGANFNLGNGYLACFVCKQNYDPIVNGFDYFSLDSLRICDKTLANGGNQFYVYDFTSGVNQNTTAQNYWLVGGIILKGANKDIFLTFPYFDNSHYHTTCFYKYTPSYSISMEVTGWSKYPTESVWHDIYWTQTDDYIGLPKSSNSYLKLRVDVDLSSWSSNTFTFTTQNTRIYCPTTGVTNYCSIYNENFNIQSSAGVINGSGTLYLGADDLFGMTDYGDEYDIQIQVNTGNNNWTTLVWVGFEGSSRY